MQIIDLSQQITGMNRRLYALTSRIWEETGDYHTTVVMDSHLGTHVEAPKHLEQSWPSVAELPASAFIGRGIRLHLPTKRGAEITGDDLLVANVGRLRAGDFALLDTDWHSPPLGRDARPRLTEKAAIWLRDKGVKGIGFGNGVSIDWNRDESLRIHRVLFPRRILLIEELANLNHLGYFPFLFIALPIPIVGLDACSVRAVAITDIPNFPSEARV